jgi:D-alanyl-D-alanine dipeptidase
VDLTLTTAGGSEVDMTSPYPPASRQSAAVTTPGLNPTARANRDLLLATLTAAGFSSYPAEWWHWEYGTPGWALRTGHEAAIYGLIGA